MPRTAPRRRRRSRHEPGAVSETFTVNGETRPWKAQTVRDLLIAAGVALDKGGLAVARNASVLPHGQWNDTAVEPDDRIEIVHIVRGG